MNVFYFNWEWDVLYALQDIHNPILDVCMKLLSDLGNAGLFCILVSIVLMIIPKYRKMGIQCAITMALAFIIGNLFFKNLLMRARPCQIDTAVQLLVKIPHDYSFPSGHTMNGFAASLSILYNNKRLGIPAVVLATLIAISRLYNFVHFPTDVIGGFIIALVLSMLTDYLVKKHYEKKASGKK